MQIIDLIIIINEFIFSIFDIFSLLYFRKISYNQNKYDIKAIKK
jgi:hypothetical protein